jgi:hypothetical protein
MNKSFSYLVPIFINFLKKENSKLNELLFAELIDDSYILYHNKNEITKKLTIVLKKPKILNYKYKKNYILLSKSSIFYKICYKKDRFIIILNVPKELNEVCSQFCEGKYSKFSDINKRILLLFAKKYLTDDFCSALGHVLSRNERIKKDLEVKLDIKLPEDSEISSKPDLISETFNYE